MGHIPFKIVLRPLATKVDALPPQHGVNSDYQL